MASNIIDYNDERLTSVEREGEQRKSEVTQNYDDMINQRDQYTQQQQQNVENWAKEQTELQQANTAHTIDKLNQQQEQAQKDYIKEQKGSYVDYMKQSNQYGAKAEQLARQGLQNSGYQESSQVSMWNTYQNRIASARESIQKANLEFANAMKEAELSNNETLAKIAQEKLEKATQIALEGFEYKNNLAIQRDNKIDEITNAYHARYQDVLAQINAEYEYAQQQKQLEEEERRWQAEYEMKMKQWEAEQAQRAIQNAQWEKEYALKKQQQAATLASLSGTSGYSLLGGGTEKLSKNAKAVYASYKLAKKVPLAGKSITLEDYLTKQYNAGNIDKNDVLALVNMYG